MSEQKRREELAEFLVSTTEKFLLMQEEIATHSSTLDTTSQQAIEVVSGGFVTVRARDRAAQDAILACLAANNEAQVFALKLVNETITGFDVVAQTLVTALEGANASDGDESNYEDWAKKLIEESETRITSTLVGLLAVAVSDITSAVVEATRAIAVEPEPEAEPVKTEVANTDTKTD